jgi:hypothetical protein
VKTEGQFALLTREEFASWLKGLNIQRKITLVQEHHTASPDYRDFNGSNHFKLCESMKAYHVNNRGFQDIAQNFTTFPDGTIMVCRPLNTAPAGIKGANANGICIENVGNFDKGKDTMTEEQKKTILFMAAALCKKFNLPIDTNHIVYHHWYDLNTGVRTNGTGVTKSCPGTNFSGGNTVDSAQKYFIPLVKEAFKVSFDEALDVISKKAGVNKNYWVKKKNIDPYFETLMIKIATAMKG